MKKSFTDKQKRFVTEYLIDLNATAAAKRAGYSEKSADKIGPELLGKTSIQEALSKALAKRSERTEITQDWVLSRLQTVAERCLQAAAVIDKEGNPTGEYKFDSSGANKSLELLGKHLKLFTEKVELTGKDGGPMQIENLTNEELDAKIAELTGRLGITLPGSAG
jgi:phage terminase small subunit